MHENKLVCVISFLCRMFRVAPYIGVLELDLVFNMLVDLRFRHQAVWREAHGQDPCSSLKKSVA